MTYRVVFRPQARRDLNSIVDYIARDNRAAARKLATEVRAFGANLRYFPMRRRPRDDLEPGLRTLSYRGRVLIAYRVEGQHVRIVNILYAGRDYEAILRGDHSR